MSKDKEPNDFAAFGAAGLCFGIALMIPLEGTDPVAIACGALTLVALWPREELPKTSPGAHAVAHFAIVAAMLLSIRGADAGYDYYRFWAGNLARRGQDGRAAEMCEHANDALPGEPVRHFQLAEVYQRLGQDQKAEREYRRGIALDPESPRAVRARAVLGASSP